MSCKEQHDQKSLSLEILEDFTDSAESAKQDVTDPHFNEFDQHKKKPAQGLLNSAPISLRGLFRRKKRNKSLLRYVTFNRKSGLDMT